MPSKNHCIYPPSPAEIFKVINSLNSNKTFGHDNVLTLFLQLGNEIIAPKLSNYFYVAFTRRFFLQVFKLLKLSQHLNLETKI